MDTFKGHKLNDLKLRVIEMLDSIMVLLCEHIHSILES